MLSNVGNTNTCVHLAQVKSTNFPQRIKQARGKLGLSQRAAARLWRFPQTTLRYWEEGERTPAGLYKQKLERVLRRVLGD
jgi:DNA-binding transcriptional regulator YiaG